MNKRCFVSEFEDAAHTNSLICVLADTQKKQTKKLLFICVTKLFEREGHPFAFGVDCAGEVDWRSVGERRFPILVEAISR